MQKVRFSIEGNITQGTSGAEVRVLGSRGGVTEDFAKYNLVGVNVSFDSEEGFQAGATVFNDKTNTFGTSGGDVLGFSEKITLNENSQDKTLTTEISAGLFYLKNETTIKEDGTSESSDAVGVQLGGTAGTMILGIEGNISVEIVIPGQESGGIPDNDAQERSTVQRDAIHVQPTIPVNVKEILKEE